MTKYGTVVLTTQEMHALGRVLGDILHGIDIADTLAEMVGVRDLLGDEEKADGKIVGQVLDQLQRVHAMRCDETCDALGTLTVSYDDPIPLFPTGKDEG